MVLIFSLRKTFPHSFYCWREHMQSQLTVARIWRKNISMPSSLWSNAFSKEKELRKLSHAILSNPKIWFQTIFRAGSIYHLFFFLQNSVVHIIKLLPRVYVKSRGSLLRTDSPHLREQDAEMQLLLVLKRTWHPDPAGCLWRVSDSGNHSTTDWPPSSPDSPRLHPAYPWTEPEACWQAPPSPASTGLQSHLIRNPWGCLRTAAQLSAWVTAMAAHPEWGLSWNM